ncbi:hypothetical protein ACFU6K_07780 [Kitasatospora sp. NPDC057512]|uniref:hypothetical protein n=1 Tax=Kitasatospora sp. NPDC057512 TaxID=3346154 RepID=UPI0036C0B8EA
MYSYDVSASPGRSATASRSIPGMRPSYDAEHPHSATPIYDELYSEYRRLFRALPGDRSNEEDLKFTGFAVRDGYPLLGEQRPYPPQQQTFHTLPGQVPGLPQFMPGSQHHGSGPTGGQQHGHPGGHTGTHATPHANSHTGSHPGGGQIGGHSGGHTGGQIGGHTGRHTSSAHPGTHAASHSTSHHHGHPVGHHPESTVPTRDGLGPAAPAPAQDQPAVPAAQFTDGQGWVAAGYLGAAPMPVPAPAPPAPPAPSPVMGTATGLAPAPSSGGRHRQMLSLPPGPTVDHR